MNKVNFRTGTASGRVGTGIQGRELEAGGGN